MRACAWALAFVAIGFTQPVQADLPVHCLLQDVVGEWTFHVGPPQAPPFPDLRSFIPTCGHHIPNTVTSMLDLDRLATVPSTSEERVAVRLTEDVAQSPDRHLRAVVGGGEEAAWTMVFDEGFEVRSGNRSFFAHFHFEAMHGKQGKDGDRWTEIGQYHGRDIDPNETRLEPKGDLYACHCDQTSTGWWHRRASSGSMETGCFWATKTGSAVPKQPAALTAFVRSAPKLTSEPLKRMQTESASNDRVHDLLDLSGRDWTFQKEVFSSQKATQSAEPAQISTRGGVVLSALRGARKPLPKHFDWRDVMADMSPEGVDDLSEQFSQGRCGSCYAFSATQVLQMRFRIKLWQQHKVLYPLELSWKSVTRCSPYTEGCEGGFAYLGFKYAAEVGLPLATCDQAERPESLDNTCDWGCYRNNSDIFYAKDYGHTGGFSHGASEEAMMREIHENGPVIVSFSTTAVPEFNKNSGLSYKEETEVMTAFRNERTPKETFSEENEAIHEWRYTTHSILAVGWGEEETSNGDTIKYWTVRNSWGKDWGVDGYAKIRRGRNDAAIETTAPWVTPDMERLPPGFLERARRYHEEHAAERARAAKGRPAAAKGAASAKASGRARRSGVPEYCRLRPDSPDCQ